MGAPDQAFQLLPPRRGAVFALTVDSTARSYNISQLALGGYTPDASCTQPKEVVLFVQAQSNAVFIHFRSDSASADLSDTAAISAGGAVAFDNTYGAVIPAGLAPMQIVIRRDIDKYMVVKAASSSGILRFWAASCAE